MERSECRTELRSRAEAPLVRARWISTAIGLLALLCGGPPIAVASLPGEQDAGLPIPYEREPGATQLDGVGGELVDLVFLIDGSGSISTDGFDFQVQGIYNAICGPDAIIPHNGSTAVAVVQFYDIAWYAKELTVLDTPATANDFCADVLAIPKMGGGTNMPAGLGKAIEILANEAAGIERVVVVGTDGDWTNQATTSSNCETLRTMTPVPAKVCVVMIPSACPTDLATANFFKGCANSSDAPTFNPAQPEGHFVCAETLSDHAFLCGECFFIDCNGNGVHDPLDIAAGTSTDCDANRVPDECQGDCNNNGEPDPCDIASGLSDDCDANGVPDECQPDCNGNGQADPCDISGGGSSDCNLNGTPDECDLVPGGSGDCNGNGVPDECDIDCDENGVPDDCGPSIIYVNAAAAGANTGEDWPNAFTDLQSALAVCPPCTETQVWVAAGTYYPGPAGSNRDTSFELCNELALFGGFDGTETQRELRNPHSNLTILSGDLGRNDPLITENSYHVVVAENLNTSAVLDGVTVRAGLANGTVDRQWGGGLLVKDGGPTIRTVRFEDNGATYGGAAAVTSASGFADVSFENCEFEFNSAVYFGGGLYTEYATARPKDCLFSGNVIANPGSGGGAIYSYRSATVMAEDCVFVGNAAHYGGAIRVRHALARASNCTFRGNSAAVSGGAGEASYDPAGSVTPQSSRLEIYNSILWDNTAGSGGHELAISQGSASRLVAEYSDVQGGSAEILLLAGQASYSATNIQTDPLYVDELGRIDRLSPCIDTGLNSAVFSTNFYDFDGKARIADGNGDGTSTVDRGAFETPVPCNEADVNCDGAVDAGDLLSIRAPGTWQYPVHCPPEPGDAGQPRADVNDDGAVDSGDLLSVRAPGVWQTTTGPCDCLDHCPGGESLMGGGEMLALAADSANEADAGGPAPTPQTLAVQILGPGGVPTATMAAGSSCSLSYTTSLAQVDFALVAVRPISADATSMVLAPALDGPFSNPAGFASGTAEPVPDQVVGYVQNDLASFGQSAGPSAAIFSMPSVAAGQFELSFTLSGLDAAGTPAVAIGSIEVTVNP